MKLNRRNRFLSLLGRFFTIPAMFLSMISASNAVVYFWDGATNVANGQTNNATTTAQNWVSGGNWDSGTGGTSVARLASVFTSADDVVFGGTAASQTVTAGTLTIRNMTFGGGTAGSTATGAAYTISGGAITLASSTITTNTNINISSPLSGTTGFTKAGNAYLTVSGNHAGLSGTTTINAGGLTMNTATNTTAVVVNTGGQFYGGWAITGTTFANNFTISGTGFTEGGIGVSAIRASNNQTFSGSITLNAASRIGMIETTAASTFSGRITGNFALNIQGAHNGNSGTQTFTLANTGTASDYTGDLSLTTVGYGGARTGARTILRLNADNQIPNGTGRGNLILGGADANNLTIFELNGRNETINGLSNASAAGAIIRNTTSSTNSILTIGDANANGSFSGVVTDSPGTLSLTKIGTGTYTFSGVNTYTGATTIDTGTLVIDSSGAIATSDLLVKNAATLQLNASAKTLKRLTLEDGARLNLPVTAAQTIAITDDLVFSSATTNFTVRPAFAGTVAAGTYDLLTPGSISNIGNLGAITLDTSGLLGRVAASSGVAITGGKLVMTVGFGYASLVWDNVGGTGTGNWSVQTPADNNFKNAGVDDQFYQADTVSFTETSAGPVAIVGTVLPASITVNSTTDYSFGGAGSIGGTTGLTKSGSSNLTISNSTPNTFTGATVLNNGTITAAVSGALGASPAVTINAGTLNLNASSATTASTITLNGGILALGNATALTTNPALVFGSASTGIVRLNGNNMTVVGLNTTGLSSSPIVENGSGITDSVLTYSTTTNSTFSGVLRDGAANKLALTTAGTGILTLSGASSNTYTGKTTVGGTGQFVLAKSSGAIAVPGDIDMAASGARAVVATAFDNQFSSASVMRFTTANDTRFELKGTTQTLGGIDNTGFTASTFQGVQHNEFSSSVTSVDTLSTLVLNVTGSNSFTFGSGNTTAFVRNQGGTLELAKLGTGTQTFFGAGITYSGATTVSAGRLALTDTTGFVSPTAVATGATLSLNRSVATLASRNRVSGLISGTGIVEINNTTAGIAGGWVTFNAANSGLSNFFGTLNVNSGVLSMDNIAGTWTNSAPTVNVAAGGLFAVRAQSNVTMASLNGAGDVGNFHNSIQTLTVGSANGSGNFSGILHGNNTTSGTDGSLECGTLNLTKVGTGTQILSGINTYTGSTTVNEGTLVLAGGSAIVDTNAITLANVASAKLRLDAAETIGSISGGGLIGGELSLQSNTLTLGGNNTNSTFAGPVSGTGGGLTKVGTGTLTLSGTGTFTGTTAVNAGTLVLSGTGVSAIDLNTGTLLLSGTTTGTLDATTGTTLSGEGTAGNAVIGVDSTSVATLVVDPSTPAALTVGALELYGKISVSLSNGLFSPGVPFTILKFDSNESGFLDADFQLVGGASYRAPTFVVDEASTPNTVSLTMGSLALTWNNGATSGIWDNSALNFRNGAVDSDFKWGDFVTFNDAASPAGPGSTGAQAISISGEQRPAGVTITGSANNYTFSGSGKISGFTGLLKSGTSTARFNQLNDYSGGTSITEGILEANAASALGTGTINVNGGTLNAMFAGSLGSAPVTLTTGSLNVTAGSGLGTGLVTVNGGTMNASAASALGAASIDLAGGTLVVNNATTPFGTATVASRGGMIQYATGITADVSSTVRNSTSAMRVDTNGNLVTWASALPNTNIAGLTKVGAGTLTLTGSSAFTGDVTIQGGVISFATTAAVGTASPLGVGNAAATALTFDGGTLRHTGAAMTSTNFNRRITLSAGGGTLDLAGTGLGWIANAGSASVISGPGSFTKLGTQQLIISGFSDYDGITFINAGEVQIRDNARGLGSTVGKTVVASGAQFATGGGGAGVGIISENIDLNGTGVSGGGALQCNDGPIANFAGTIMLVTNSSIGGGSPNCFISGPVVGTGSLTKVGTQTLTLSGTNTYTGSTIVSAGTLALTGTNVSPITLTAGTLQLSGSTTGAITAAAASTLAGEGTAATVTTSGVANLNIDPTTTGAFTTSGALTLGGTLSVGLVGPVTGSGAIRVLNYGTTTSTAANFTLASPTSLRGGATATFTVADGAVTLNGLSKKSIEWSLVSTTGTWDSGTTANFRDTTTLASERFFTGDDVIFGNLPGTSPSITISGTVLPSSITINSSANYTFTGGSIAGTTSIVKSGTGAISLGQANTFTGGVTVSQGSVTLTNATAAGTGTILLGDAGTGANNLTLTANLAATFANPITVTSSGTGLVTITQSLASTLSGALTFNRPVIINSNAAAFVLGKITGTVGTLTFGGSSTTSLSNTVASDFTGNIEIVGGITQATAMANALPPTASLTIRSGVFQLTNGFSQSIDALNGGVVGATGVQNANATAATLTLGSANGSGTFLGNIVAGTGPLSIIKTGTGTQVFTGILSYTGTTAVNQGALHLPSQSTLTGAVTVANGATLAVGGQAGFTLTTNSLTLGTSAATTLAINNLSPTPIGVPLRVNTTMATNGPVTLNVDLTRISATGTYPLIAYPATGISGSGFGAFTLGTMPSGFVASLNNNTSTNTIELVVTSVGSTLWVGNNGSAWDVNSTENWLVGVTPSKYQNGDKVVFDDTATTFTPSLGVTVTPTSVVFNNATTDYTLNGLGGIGGMTSITKTGNAKVTLTTANSTTGLTSITAGTLQLGDGVTNGSLAGDIANNTNLIFANANTQTYAGRITNAGAVTKTGAGKLILTGVNTYSGGTTVANGILQLGDGLLNGTAGTGTYSLASGSTLFLNYATAVAVNTWSFGITGAGTIELNSAQPVNGSANWGPNSATATPLNPAFTGTLQVNRGRFDSSPVGLGGTSNVMIKNGAQFLAWAGTYLQPFSIEGDGWGEAGQSGSLRVAGSANNATFNGNITLTGNASLNSQDANSIMTLNGVIGGTGDLTRFNPGRINFYGSSSNTWTGGLILNSTSGVNTATTLFLGKTGGALAVPANTTITFGNGASGESNLRMEQSNQFGAGVVINFVNPSGSPTRMDLRGTQQSLAGINSGTLTTQGSGIMQNRAFGDTTSAHGIATLTLNGSGSYLFNGILRDVDSGSVSGNILDLVKTGSGTQTFAGNLIAHTGFNTISGGTLVLPTRTAPYGNTSVDTSGAKLGITGSSGSVFTVPSLTFASGTNLSVRNFANLTGANRCINVTSSLSTSGTVTVDIPTMPSGAGPFPIIQYPLGSYAGNDFVLDTSGWTLSRSISSPALINDTVNGVISLTATYTPLVWVGTTSAWNLTTQNWSIAGNPADYDEGDVVQFDETGTATNPNVVLNIAVAPSIVNFMNTTNPYSISGSGGIGGTATINKSGTGTVVLRNANPTTGLTTITQGTLQLGDGTVNGSVGGNISLAGATAPDATLVLNPTTQTLTNIISGSATSGTVSKIGAGTAILTGVNTYLGATTINGGTLQLGDGVTQPTINSTYAITSPGTLKIQYNSVGAAAQTWSKFTGNGTLALATGRFNDAAWGNATLANTFTGTLRIETGRVALLAATGAGTNFGLGGTTKIVITNGGHLGMWENGITLPATMAFEIAGTGYGEVAYEVAMRMANGGAVTTVNGPILLTASASLGAQGNGIATVNGIISGGVGADLTIGGAVNGGSATGWQDGTIALAAANTFVGKATVNMGTLRLDNALALQNNTLNLNGITGSTGNPLGQATFNSTVVGNAFTLGGLEGYRPLALQNTASAAIALSVGNNNTSTTYTGNLTGAGSLLKIGSGTLTLSGPLSGSPAVPTSNSTFTGNITVSSGKLIGAAVRTGNNTVFGVASNTRTITVESGAFLEFHATNTFGGHNTINAPTLVVNGGTVTNADPLVTDRINNGLRNVTLNNGSLLATVGNGTSDIDVVNRPGEGYGAWGLNGTVTSTGTSLISTGSLTGKAGRILLSSNTADTIFNVTSGTLTVAAPLQTGESTPSFGMNKTGAGTLVLSAVNVHSTPTLISGGTLELSGSMVKPSALIPASPITVAATGTLTGAGAAEGTLTVQPGGTVAPGVGVGTLTTGAAAIAGTFACEVSGATSDKLVVNGDLNLSGALTVSGSATFTSPVVLIDYSSGAFTRSGTFSSVPTGYTVTYDDLNRRVLLARAGYDAWAAQIADAGKRGKGDDADGDGFSNLQEFLFGKDPEVNDGSMTSTERTANGLVVRWNERTTNATYKFQENALLSGAWTDWVPTPPTFILENDGAQVGDAIYGFYQPRKATVPLTPSRNFFRVEGTETN